MAVDLSFSGLASGFDWKTFVNAIMTAESVPITSIQTKQKNNTAQNAALTEFQTDLTTMQMASTAMAAPDLFGGRTATSSTANSTWTPIASNGTPAGSYNINVSALATAASLKGSTGISGPLSATNDVSALTIANLHVANAVTAGTFTVNGNQVTVASTDSLAQVFTAISTATSGAVTASYDSASDAVTLHSTSGGEIILGAANDTSNFLSSLNLNNTKAPGDVVSSSKLGSLSPTSILSSAGLKTPVTAVDGSGNGSFSINGVNINYNLNTSYLGAVITNINESSAGVTAAYDPNNDRLTLTNNTTGDTNITVSEAAGGLLSALGVTSGVTPLVRGTNAQFSINSGATRTSASNTLSAAALGVPGLSVTANTTGTQTITVAGNTSGISTGIANFIAAFNTLQTFLDTNTTNTVSGTTVTPGLLSGNREIQDWGTTLRSKIFNSIPGLTGAVSRLNDLGIDFTPGTSQLAVTNQAKLTSVLANNSNDVANFFQNGTAGMAFQMSTYVGTLLTANTQQQTQLTKTNADLDTQIATIQRQLDQQKAQLTASFIAMESAQATMKTQSAALASAFSTSASTNTSTTSNIS